MAKKNPLNIEAELKKIIEDGPPLKVRKASFVGERLKVSVNRFVEALLRVNEELPQEAKQTDETIKALVRKEYAKHAPTATYWAGDNPLASYRGKFNRGKILLSDPTSAPNRYLSVPYNADGVPIRNRRPMTAAEYLSAAAQFGLGVELDASTGQFIVHTLKHFGVVPKQLFKLKVTSKRSKKPAA